ncbi:LCP family protein [Nonomuraea dietziae]|uniref:LCP family protein n=1 Tax=Nonomuraea dietziae TaxID=65515 RepID=UPI0031CF298E
MTDRTRPAGSGAVLGWTLLSAVAPGAAHLRAGWRRTGLALLGGYALLLLGVLWLVLAADGDLAGWLIHSSAWLTAAMAAAAVLGLGWFALVVHSFLVLLPGRLPQRGQLLTGVAAGLLSVAVVVPFAATAQLLWVSDRTIDSVFNQPTEPQAGEREPADPWAARTRVNLLLLGGDADDNRTGVRTDSMNVASIDVKTGNTVLFSLPRNLENVRFPPGSPMAKRFPDGFRLPTDAAGGRSDLLNSVWEYADAHPEIFGGRKGQGAQALMDTIGYTLGLEIDWYALVNMWGFARLIDAIGGVTIHVEQDVVFGKYNEGLVKAGTRKLKGGRRDVVRPLAHLQRRLHPHAQAALRHGRAAQGGRPHHGADQVQRDRAGHQGAGADRHPPPDAGAPGPAGAEGEEREGHQRAVRASADQHRLPGLGEDPHRHRQGAQGLGHAEARRRLRRAVTVGLAAGLRQGDAQAETQ